MAIFMVRVQSADIDINDVVEGPAPNGENQPKLIEVLTVAGEVKHNEEYNRETQ